MLSIENLIERGDEAREGDGDLIAAFKWYEKAVRRGSLEALKEIIDIGEELNISFWDGLLAKYDHLIDEGVATQQEKDGLFGLSMVRVGDDEFDAALQKLHGEAVKLDMLDQCLEEFHDTLVECCDASDPEWMGVDEE